MVIVWHGIPTWRVKSIFILRNFLFSWRIRVSWPSRVKLHFRVLVLKQDFTFLIFHSHNSVTNDDHGRNCIGAKPRMSASKLFNLLCCEGKKANCVLFLHSPVSLSFFLFTYLLFRQTMFLYRYIWSHFTMAPDNYWLMVSTGGLNWNL